MIGGYPGRERIVLQPVDESGLFEARIQGFDEVQGDVRSPFRFLKVEPAESADDKHLYRIEVATEAGEKPPRVAAIAMEQDTPDKEGLYRIHFDPGTAIFAIRFVTLEPAEDSKDELYKIVWAEEGDTAGN